MNNACPSCGAVYAVTAKDVGRKIKCKKCGTALVVTEDGLEDIATVQEAPPAAMAAVEDDEAFDTRDDDDGVSTRGRKAKKGQRDRQGRQGPALAAMMAKVGGVPTILFGIGVFLVIWFTFMGKIGDASIQRAAAGPQKVQMDLESRKQAISTKYKMDGKPSEDDTKKAMDELKKLAEEFLPKIKDAEENYQSERIGVIRSLWYDRYGTMFGFIFLAFGCIGYLRTEQPLVLRIVAAVIISVMMIVVFSSFSGGGGGATYSPNSPMPASTSMGGLNKGGAFKGPTGD